MPRDTCYYDGHCGMCRRTVRWLRALDWFSRLDIKDMTAVPPAELPVPMETAMTGMPMRTRGGRILVGFDAVRRALSQTIAAPLGWLLYLPGVNWAGRRAYRWVAANRRRSCTVSSMSQPST
jgi:predicted DCC family thiol-disulfide oxidoreductase YuxK